jgi:hypothetical protein
LQHLSTLRVRCPNQCLFAFARKIRLARQLDKGVDVPMLEWLVRHGYRVEVGHKLSKNAAIKGNANIGFSELVGLYIALLLRVWSPR